MPNVKIFVLNHPLGDLGLMHRVHLWLDGKCIVDFLLAIIQLFSLALTTAALLSEMSKLAFSERVGQFEPAIHQWIVR